MKNPFKRHHVTVTTPATVELIDDLPFSRQAYEDAQQHRCPKCGQPVPRGTTEHPTFVDGTGYFYGPASQEIVTQDITPETL